MSAEAWARNRMAAATIKHLLASAEELLPCLDPDDGDEDAVKALRVGLPGLVRAAMEHLAAARERDEEERRQFAEGGP